MKNIILFSIFLILLSCQSKTETDYEALSAELDSIFEVDQKYRKQWLSVQKTWGPDSKELNELREKQEKADSSNLIRVIEIIDRLGTYPGKSLVGNSAGKTVFYVLQHAPDSIQEKYYDLTVEAANNNELDKRLAAMYRDRYLMHKNQPQVFGTQVILYSKVRFPDRSADRFTLCLDHYRYHKH